MKMNRRTFLKKMFGSLVGLVGLTGFGYYYSRYIEPDLLTIQTYTLEHLSIPPGLDQLKIIQFSDTHLGFHYNLDQLRNLVDTIQKQKPEIIVFTGDLIDAPHQYHFTNELPTILNQLEAPLGKYWIYGNHDHGGYGTEKIREVMERGGFQLLKNRHVSIPKGGDTFILAGLDDIMLGRPDIEETLNNADPSLFTLLLVHEPDIAEQLQSYPINVQLSGHSHGGQIQLPFYGPLVTPPYAQKYIEGHHHFDQGLDLYVNKGIGTTRMPYRLLCFPEISVFTLKSKRL